MPCECLRNEEIDSGESGEGRIFQSQIKGNQKRHFFWMGVLEEEKLSRKRENKSRNFRDSMSGKKKRVRVGGKQAKTRVFR